MVVQEQPVWQRYVLRGVRPPGWPQQLLPPEHEDGFQHFLTSKEKTEAGETRGRQQRKRKGKQIEPRNEPLLFWGKESRFLRPSYNCDGRMVRTRFRRNRKRAVWRKPTLSRRKQRTTMKACLLTVTKCHKNAQSHTALPPALPHPRCCRASVHSRARRRQLRARHHSIHTSTHSNHHSNVQQ